MFSTSSIQSKWRGPKIIKQTGQRKKPSIHEKINQATKHVEVPQAQFLDKAGDMPVVVQRQIPMVQTVQKTMEIPQLQIVEKPAETPRTQTIQGTRTSESLGHEPVRQVAQEENVEMIKIGAPLPAESASPISVTAPVMGVLPVVAPARAITYAHGAPVVEYVTPDPHVEEIAIPVPQVMTQEVLVPVAVPKTLDPPPCPAH